MAGISGINIKLSPPPLLLYYCSISGDDDADVRERAVEIIKSLRAAQAYFSFIDSMKKKLKEIPTRRPLPHFHCEHIIFPIEPVNRMITLRYSVANSGY